MPDYSDTSRDNTTAYAHPQETNLLNLHKAMEYDAAGKPVVRVRVDGGQVTISGDVIVDEVGLTAETLAALETTTVLQGTDPWIIGDGGGSISIDDGGNVITVDGTVSINQPVAVTEGDFIVDAGYIDPNGQGAKLPLDTKSAFQLGRESMGATSEIITIAAATGSANKDVYASFGWIEVR